MPDTSEQRVTNRATRALPLGGGGCTMAFGMPFAAIGILFFTLGVTNRIKASDAAAAALFGLVFASAGMWLVTSGARGAWRARRAARWLRDHPREPWGGDHSWDRRGEASSTPSGLGCLGFLLGVLLLGSPVAVKETQRVLTHDAAFRAAWETSPARAMVNEAPRQLQVLAGIGLLLTAVTAFVLVQAVLYRLRYGTARFEFDAFPFFVGEPVQGRVRLRAPPGGFNRVTLELRFLEERNERGSKRGSNVMNVYQLWSDRRTFERAALGPGRALVLPVRFDAPADERLATALSGLPPRYWVLDVVGEAPMEFRASFLVPIYGR